MRYLRHIVCPVLLTVVLLLAVRGLLINHIRLPEDTAVRGLLPGQRAFVSLTYYGLRLPGEQWWGYHRWGYRVPEVGEFILFNLPASIPAAPVPQSVGICQALPGDTVWIDPVRKLILPARTSPDAEVLVIPQRNRSLPVTLYNAHLLAYLLRQYEGCHATTNAQGQLLLDRTPVSQVRFSRDYYWIETRNDAYVLVPHDALIGKVVKVLNR